MIEEHTRIERILRATLGERLRLDEPMAKHTTIGVGGCARYFALPRSAFEVASLIRYASSNSVPLIVIGRGSNLVVRDAGFDGLVIKLAGNYAKIRVNAKTVFAEAGASLSHLANKMVGLGRGGLEFAVGIPGSVGGAVWMNAGAYGSEIARVMQRMRWIDKQGSVTTLYGKKTVSRYRRPPLPAGATVLSVTLNCPPGGIDKRILQLSRTRKKTQPLGEKSFGCAFVNPPGQHAGRLIEQCGLKGKRIGGAVISKKHANFILNAGPETRAADIEALIALAKREVRNRYGITLQQEVVIVGNK